MRFASDNVAGVAPEVLAALAAANAGPAAAYGNDAASARLEATMSALFERAVRVFPVATGTAANALSLALLAPPWGAVCAHAEAHAVTDEGGAPEQFSGGAKLVGLPGAHAKLAAATLEAWFADTVFRPPHSVKPAALTLSQATEAGTVYTPAEIAALAAVAHAHGLGVHMDGARLANALVHLACTPAEATWRAGVDILSFGLTKNGALAAEAIVLFDADPAGASAAARVEALAYRRKRAGQLFSKQRFAAAQFEAMLTDGLWLRLAAHANAMARRLGDGLAALPGVRLVHPVEANEVFPEVPEAVARVLGAPPFGAGRWTRGSPAVLRLVCAFDVTAAEVDALLTAARAAA